MGSDVRRIELDLREIMGRYQLRYDYLDVLRNGKSSQLTRSKFGKFPAPRRQGWMMSLQITLHPDSPLGLVRVKGQRDV